MKSIVITVTDEALGHINDVVHQLERQGVHIERVMPRMGVISGTSTSSIAELKQVEGVMDVQEEVVHKMPPAKSRIQ
jgi:hypothetical protein